MNTTHKKGFCLYCPSAFLPPSSLTNDDNRRKLALMCAIYRNYL